MNYQSNINLNKDAKQRRLIELALLLLFIYLSYLSIVSFLKQKSYLQSSLIEEAKYTEDYEDDAEDVESNLNLQFTLKQNESLLFALQKNHVNPKDIKAIDSLLKSNNLNKKIQKGSRVILDLSAAENHPTYLNITSLNIYSLDNLSQIQVIKDGETFSVKEILAQLIKNIIKIQTKVNTSIFNSLKSLGVPNSSINEIINAYSHQIDFQRQIKPGDSIELLIEKYTKPDDGVSHYGNIVSAKLNLSNQSYDIYRYNSASNSSQYFSKEGKSFRRNLLKTPIKAARISSYFGNRMHPVLGYTRMHQGIDFAASLGTPIYSAGDGVITEMGKKGGYGNYIKVKHSSHLSTLYAHISKFNKSLAVGSKVKQGKTIAYVGSTGTSSGSHLHYEVHINGNPVNPLGIKTLSDTVLKGEELKKFVAHKNQIQDIDKFLDNNESYQLSSSP
jgi:hypothetical protein